MNLSELIFTSLIALFLIWLSFPSYLAETEQSHDHRMHYVPMNGVKGSYIKVCISEGDTVAQVAFPHTNMTKHIDYDTAN